MSDSKARFFLPPDDYEILSRFRSDRRAVEGK